MQHHNKSSRRKASSIASTTSSSSSTSAKSHPYLGNQQINAIESWKTSVPTKSIRPQDMPDEDPVIQAYLQTKMALFQSMEKQKIAATSRDFR